MQPEMRRKDRRLPEEEALAVLEGGEYGVLATVGADGWPYAAPLSYVMVDGGICFHCAREGRKLRNLAHEPRACFTVVGAARPEYAGGFTAKYESAMAFGTVSRVEEDGEKLRILELLCRKYLPDDMDKFDRDARASLRVTDVWRIRIETVTGKANR